MKNIREYDFWDNEYFGTMNRPMPGPGEWLFRNGIVALVAGSLGMAAVGLPLEGITSIGAPALIIGLLAGAIIGLISIRLGKVYKGHSMPHKHSYIYGWQYNFRERAQEYFSLPPEDRRLYPDDLMNLMRDPDLTEEQRIALDDSLSRLYSDIQERNKQKRLTAKKDVDISGIVEHIRANREYIKVEIDVFKEFS